MATTSINQAFEKMSTQEDAIDLVYRVLQNANGTVDDIAKRLFFIGEYQDDEAKEIESKLLKNSDGKESYNGEKVHVTRIGTPNGIELWSLDNQEKFLKAFFGDPKTDLVHALMISIMRLEGEKKVILRSHKKIPYGYQAIYGVCDPSEYASF